MSVDYEWDVEEVEVAGDSRDVIDHNHVSSYAEAKVVAAGVSEEGVYEPEIVLVRDADKGRSWAYMKDGKLPEWFEDAHGVEVAKVPKRFIDEVSMS